MAKRKLAREVRVLVACKRGRKPGGRSDALAAATPLSLLPKFHSASVFRRLLHMVDDENLGECLGGVKLKPYLLLNRGIQPRGRRGAVGWGRNLGSHSAELRIVGRPLEGEVEPSV